MGTPFREVYETFLAGITQDEWNLTTEIGFLEKDWFTLLKEAIVKFMFPRISLKYNETEECFLEELGNEEMQLIAILMRNAWLKRALYSYKLVEQQYNTKDFQLSSQANHMEKLKDLVEYSDRECKHRINLYSRVIDHKPLDWANKFAGGKYGN